MNARFSARDFLWMSAALLPLIGVSFLLAIPAQDYWWYLRLGRDILAERGIPRVDAMSYSRAGLPIFYQQWAAGAIFQVVHEIGGASGIFLLRGALLGLTYGGLWQMMRRYSEPLTATLLALLMGLATANNWAMRPQWFAYALFVLCVWALLQWQEGDSRFLFLLPFSVLLWANLHGSFALPFILAGSALIFGGGARKPLAAALGLMALASLVNPYGFGVWRYLVFMLNSPSDYLFSVEWLPPSNSGWQLNIFFGWLLLFAPLASFARSKISLMEWVWLLGFGWLALSGIRYIIWFMFLLALFTAKLIGGWKEFFPRLSAPKAPPMFHFLSGVLLLSAALIFLPGARETWQPAPPPLYELSTTPVEAARWLESHPELPGPMWNNYAFGSYLEYALPQRPVWIDTRMYHYPPEQWAEYVAVSKAENWREFFNREGINLLFLATASQGRLIQEVANSPEWREAYRDKYAVIFTRRETKP